jgi:small conductance mechanosensitive channel
VDEELLTETCGTDPSWVCQQVLESTDGNESLARTADFLLAKPLQILLILLIAWIVTRLLRRAIQRFMTKLTTESFVTRLAQDDIARQRAASRAATIAQVLRSVATAIVYSIALLMVLGEIGINLAPLLAGAGIAGIAIGFGAQSLVKDFLSGVFMLVEDQYGVGDVVDLGDATGTVEAVTLRSTRLRDVNGTVWHVPTAPCSASGTSRSSGRGRSSTSPSPTAPTFAAPPRSSRRWPTGCGTTRRGRTASSRNPRCGASSRSVRTASSSVSS